MSKIIDEFERWQRDHYNFITPDLIRCRGIGEKYIVELSGGSGLRGERIYGVTLLKKEDDSFSTDVGNEIGVNKAIFARGEAEKYFYKVSSAVEACHFIDDEKEFEACVDRKLEREE